MSRHHFRSALNGTTPRGRASRRGPVNVAAQSLYGNESELPLYSGCLLPYALRLARIYDGSSRLEPTPDWNHSHDRRIESRAEASQFGLR